MLFQKPSDENDKIKPWTKLAKAKQNAEEELRKVQGYADMVDDC
jgi:hypothetical protein